MRRKVLNLLPLLVLIGFLSSCAALSPAKQYLVVAEQFNTHLAYYLDAYDAADKETQEEWRVKYDPKIRETALLMAAWEYGVRMGNATPEQRTDAIKAKDDLIDMLNEISGGVK